MTPRTDGVFQPRTVLVTGGAGFIGSNLVRWLLAHEPALRVVNYDLLTYAGNPESLEDVQRRHGPGGDGRYVFLHGDIRDFDRVATALRADDGVDAVLHLAAESHVDRSIMGPEIFVDTNVRGTLVASLLLGVVENLGSIYLTHVLDRDAIGFLFLIVVLMIRPQGLVRS